MQKVLILICLTAFGMAQGQAPEVAFRVAEKDLIPEGITWNPSTGNFYIGSIHKNKIIEVSTDGKVSDYVKSNEYGLGQVLGMHIDASRGHLWACSNEGENLVGGKSFVHQFDLNSGKLVNRFEYSADDEVHLFNDLIVTAEGEAYISDSDFGAIFKISPASRKIEMFLDSDQLQYCNGITTSPDGSKLIVSTGKGLVSVDFLTKEIERINLDYLSIADGLYRYKNSLVAIQNIFFPITVVQFHLNESFDTLKRASVLAVDHPLFDIPTTGVVVNEWFYFIANSQLLQLDKNLIKNPDVLKEVVIMRVKLN